MAHQSGLWHQLAVGKTLTEYDYSIPETISRGQCALHCINKLQDGCISYAYNSVDNTCYISSTPATIAQTPSSDLVVYECKYDNC